MYLIESGLVVSNRLIKDVLPALFNAYIQASKAGLSLVWSILVFIILRVIV